MTETAAAADFRTLDHALQQADAEVGAAEAHGLLCGMLCAGTQTPERAWLEQIVDPMTTDARAGSGHALTAVYRATRAGLTDPALVFQPMLPADTEPLPSRARALAQWCQGFLAGLGLGGLRDLDGLDGEVREFVRDMTQISRADFDTGAGGEEDEAAYAEIVEYLRMGVLLTYETLNPEAGPAADPERIH